MKPALQKQKQAAIKAGQKIKDMDHRDLGSSGFWISQMFLVLATVVGVYLAAHSGLKQALVFDSVTNKERNYYLRLSLHDELQDNVRALRTYTDEALSQNLSSTMLRDQRPELSQFVWETMRYSPRTLETPSVFLTEGRRFYARAENIITRAENNTYGAGHAAQRMTALLDEMEDTLLPRLRRNYRALGEELVDLGMDIEGLKETR